MHRWFIAATLPLLACAPPPRPTGGTTSSSGTTQGTPVERIVLDVPGAGAAIRAVPAFEGEEIVVTIKVQGAPQVFGLSYHVRFDPDRLALQAARDGEEVAIFGTDGLHVRRADAGDVSLGGTRKSPAAGEVTLADDTVLATLRFQIVQPGPTRISVDRVSIRRADGAFVPAQGLGAEVRP